MDWLVSAIEKTTVNRETGCWEYSYDLSHNGYGRVMIDDKRIRIHRASYSHFVGEIPEGILVCHHCDVRHCWNPKHLFTGNAADNFNDMVSKGRWAFAPRKPKGEPKVPIRQKLKPEDVKAIRTDTRKHAEIAGQYGVSVALVSHVKHRRVWSHITD